MPNNRNSDSVESRGSRKYSSSRSRSVSGRSRSRSNRRTNRKSSSRSPPRNGRASRHNPEKIDPSCCIGVFGLSKRTDEDTLWDTFDKYGRIESVKLIMNKQRNESLGYGFIYYTDVESASKAIKKASGMYLDGRNIRVDFSITKRAHTPTPGVYKGKRTARSSYNYRRSRSGRRSSRNRSRSRSSSSRRYSRRRPARRSVSRSSSRSYRKRSPVRKQRRRSPSSTYEERSPRRVRSPSKRSSTKRSVSRRATSRSSRSRS